MNKELFISIFNLLLQHGSTKLSASKKSIVCFTHISDTSDIESLLPPTWSVNSNQPTWDAKNNKMSPAMTVVFPSTVQTADEAFADFSF